MPHASSESVPRTLQPRLSPMWLQARLATSVRQSEARGFEVGVELYGGWGVEFDA
jgi:hypothetical protein